MKKEKESKEPHKRLQSIVNKLKTMRKQARIIMLKNREIIVLMDPPEENKD